MYKIAYEQWLEPYVLKEIQANATGETTEWWNNIRLPNLTDPALPLFDIEGEALKHLGERQHPRHHRAECGQGPILVRLRSLLS